MIRKLLPVLLCLLLLSGCTQPQSVFAVERDGMTFTVDTKDRTISDGVNTYYFVRVGVGVEQSMTYRTTIIYPDRSEYTWTEERSGNIVTSGGGKGSDDYVEGRYISGELLAKVVDQAISMIPEDPINAGQIAGGIFCAIMGLIPLFLWKQLWDLKHGWTVDGGEPSELYMFSSKMSGIACIVIGLVLLLIGIF